MRISPTTPRPGGGRIPGFPCQGCNRSRVEGGAWIDPDQKRGRLDHAGNRRELVAMLPFWRRLARPKGMNYCTIARCSAARISAKTTMCGREQGPVDFFRESA
jgi:hypothetical protein